MPAPTDLLNDDVKELKADIRDICSDISILKADVHRIDVSLAEFRGEMKTLIGVAKWGVRLAAGTLVTVIGTIIAGAAGASWWASGITSEVHSINSRIDKLEGAIKAVEQPRPIKTEGSK